MNSFFKQVLATCLGILLFTIVVGLLGMLSLVGMVASMQSTKRIPDGSVLVLNLSGILDERSEDNLLTMLNGGEGTALGLDDVLLALDKAKDNERVRGIYLDCGMLSPDSYASLSAIRRALNQCKEAGKWVIAYADTYTQGTYYLASVADEVYLNPQGQVDWHGLSAQPYYLKDLLAKFGVKMQVAKVGTYKSAVEPFTATSMSDENRQQISEYIGTIWNDMVAAVGKSRKLQADSLNAWADDLITFAAPSQYVKNKMVDSLVYADGMKDIVCQRLGIDPEESIPLIGIADMCNAKGKKRRGDAVAVYYAYGEVVDGIVGNATGGTGVIDAQRVGSDLRALADDDDVAAVVLRINSPGGSAYASEQIWHAVQMLKGKKPVVVSMGGMAASGGYYISAAADYIVAEPMTLTGSIGIFGMFPDASELLTEKLGVHFDVVKTNAHSDFGTLSRPFSTEEMAYLEGYINRGYQLFRQRVADGRRLSVDSVEKIAQGRVWVGSKAAKIGLVDKLGGLDVAVAKAAELAQIGDEYHTRYYPAKRSWWEQLTQGQPVDHYLDGRLQAMLGDYFKPFVWLRRFNTHTAVQAALPYIPNIK